MTGAISANTAQYAARNSVAAAAMRANQGDGATIDESLGWAIFLSPNIGEEEDGITATSAKVVRRWTGLTETQGLHKEYWLYLGARDASNVWLFWDSEDWIG